MAGPPDLDLAALARAAASGDASPPPFPDFTPTPGFVVKTAAEDGATGGGSGGSGSDQHAFPLSKVFVNVCAAAAVPPPPGWGGEGHPIPPAAAVDALAAAAAAAGDAAAAARAADEPALCFPLSAGGPRRVTDAKGGAATAVDVVFHDVVLVGAGTSRPVKLYTIELALDAAERVLGVALSRAFKLPAARYAGGPPARHVPAREAPLVARGAPRAAAALPPAPAPRPPPRVEEVAPPAPAATPLHTEWLRPPGAAASGPVTHARVTISLHPGPAEPLNVRLSTDGRVSVAQAGARVADAALPLGLDPASAVATLDEAGRVLTVEAAVASVDQVVAGWR